MNPGDNVLTPSPEYPLYGAVLAKLGAVPNAYDLDEANGWEPDIADMERKINPQTRAILLINPSNPTGAVMSRQTLEKVLELAREHNLLILADEIYDKLIYEPGAKHISIATLAQDVPIITFNGLSKAYLVPGWRIGWAIATARARRCIIIWRACTGCCGRACRRRIRFSTPSSRRWKGRRTTFRRCWRSCAAARTSPRTGRSARRA